MITDEVDLITEYYELESDSIQVDTLSVNIPPKKLISLIKEFPGETLLEKILAFCEESLYDPKEVGDILSTDQKFKKQLKEELEQLGIFRDSFI